MTRTKQDKTGQSEAPRGELQPEMIVCIAALLEGLSDEAAGARAGVARSTVARWRVSDALFAATLQNEQWALYEQHAARLRSLASEALDVVAEALRSDDERVKLANAWKVLGAFAPPSGPTTPERVQSGWTMAALADLL